MTSVFTAASVLEQSNHGGEGGGSEGGPAAVDADGGDAGAQKKMSDHDGPSPRRVYDGEVRGRHGPTSAGADAGLHTSWLFAHPCRGLRDEVGRLHSLSSISVRLPRLEDAIDTRHLPALPTTHAFRHAHRLLGQGKSCGGASYSSLMKASGGTRAPHCFTPSRSCAPSADRRQKPRATAAPPPPQSGPAWVYPELSHQIYEADTTLSLRSAPPVPAAASRASEHAAHALDLYKSVQASTHAAFAQLTPPSVRYCVATRHWLSRSFVERCVRFGRSRALWVRRRRCVAGTLRLAEGDEISAAAVAARCADTVRRRANTSRGLSTALVA